ncbi:MAG: hypothetical protein EBZ69_08095, partial [Alphaproteobacteria bacterium]|nr:hypothetical protein [Alphaproteobacteria bacterium]
DDLNADPNANDPLTEFRAEIERLKQQQDQQQEVIQKQAETTPQFNDDLQRKMEQQMTALLESWKPGQMQVIAGAKVDGPGGDVVLGGSGVLNNPENLPLGATVAGGTNALDAARAIVPAGTVNYAQMLVEANSDVPGPIMAQILSGPLKGGRAIGKFEYLEDYLIITFDLINYKGRDYSVDALALDPDTTLGGMATETDARYFKRLVLPAAASFVSALGTSLASGGTTTTVSDGAVISTRAEQGLEDGLFEGMGAAANRVGQFLDEEAAKTKPLVRVATGTPLGLFFVKSVFEGSGNTVNVNGGGFNSLPSLGEDNGTTPADNMFTPPAGYGGSRGPQIQNFPASQGQTQQPPLPDLGPGSSIAIYPR